MPLLKYSETLLRRPTWVSAHGEHCVNLQSSTTGDGTETGKGVGLTATSIQILEDQVPVCSSPRDPSQQPWLTRKFSWQFCLIQIPSQWAKPTTELIIWPYMGRWANSQSHPTAQPSLQWPFWMQGHGYPAVVENILWITRAKEQIHSPSQLLSIASSPNPLGRIGTDTWQP